ncbi:MAG: adenylate kinase [Saccharofermentanales bacterium]|jgi:adenylate kinase
MKKEKRIVLMGAPASGKGTWSKIITEKYALEHLSTGDLLRKVREKDTPLARKIGSYMDRGALVPDDIVIGMVDDLLTEGDAADGFVFDGFPRTLPQAEALDIILERHGKSLDLVIDLDVDEQILIDRIVFRRVCSDCGQPYNLKTAAMRPKVEGICDYCNGKLIQRSDDTEETFMKRLKEYHDQADPLLDYYQKQGKRVSFPISELTDETRREMFELIEEKFSL